MKTNADGQNLISKIKSPALPLAEAEWVVNDSVRIRLNPNQFAALVCFVSCRGEHAFLRSVLLKHVNANEHFAAAKQFARWNRKSGKISRILLLRRKAEASLYLCPILVTLNTSSSRA